MTNAKFDPATPTGVKIEESVPRTFPYLQELATGFIHPYTDNLAQHGDSVRGVYNLQGSTNPDDRDDGYNPDPDMYDESALPASTAIIDGSAKESTNTAHDKQHKKQGK